MKILYVTTISDTVNAFLVPHIKLLLEQGYEVGLAFNIEQDVNPELITLGCKVHNVDFQRNPLSKENLTAYKKIKKLIIEKGYDFIHVHTPVASVLTRIACRKIKNVKVLYTAHGFHFFKGAPMKNWAIYYPLEKLVARWTDGLITMNDEDYHAARNLKIRKRGSIYKIHGVGLDTNRFIPQTNERKLHFREQYGYHANDFILIYVGELSHRKNQDMIIEAVNMVKNEIPQLKLLLVGDGDLACDYKELVQKLGIDERVEFLGLRNDVQQLMTIADLAISTSRQEGLPVNVMEAMATGLPIVVTNCRGNRDLVTNGKNGLVVGGGDTWACAKAIKRLYLSRDLRREFGNRGREMIEVYSIHTVLDELREIYFQLFLPVKKPLPKQ